MSASVKISYLIALYNKQDYVFRAVQSILDDNDSSYELEICIVDDGSTDLSLNIIKHHFEKNNQIKIQSFTSNKGKCAAYNAAYNLASGDYIALLGADDEVIKGRTLALLSESLCSGTAVYGSYIRNDLANKENKIIKINKKTNFYKNIIQNTLPGGCFFAPKKLLANIFPIPEMLKFEDWWISFHLLRCEKVNIIDLPVTLYNVGIGNDNASVAPSFENIHRDYLRHPLYYERFRPYLHTEKEIGYWLRGLALRKSVLEKKCWKSLLSKPYDSSWIKLILFNTLGAKFTFNSIALIDSIIKKLRKNI